MLSDSLTNWLTQSDSIYAILSAASDAEPLRHYQEKEGKQRLYPLYANTEYAVWTQVMPYLVRIPSHSHFFKWVEQTSATDWGWFFTSTASEQELIPYFTALTQAIMPAGDIVFFRYWDTDYLRVIFRSQTLPYNPFIPAISSCWLNGEIFNFQPDLVQPAKNHLGGMLTLRY